MCTGLKALPELTKFEIASIAPAVEAITEASGTFLLHWINRDSSSSFRVNKTVFSASSELIFRLKAFMCNFSSETERHKKQRKKSKENLTKTSNVYLIEKYMFDCEFPLTVIQLQEFIEER